jgi:hypothetical protein
MGRAEACAIAGQLRCALIAERSDVSARQWTARRPNADRLGRRAQQHGDPAFTVGPRCVATCRISATRLGGIGVPVKQKKLSHTGLAAGR